MREVELLAPAGDLEKLKIAFEYGADAVYIGGEIFGMRSAAKNFTKENMIEGVNFAHERGKRVFVTCNIIPTNPIIEPPATSPEDKLIPLLTFTSFSTSFLVLLSINSRTKAPTNIIEVVEIGK